MVQAWRWNWEFPGWSEFPQAVAELVEELLETVPAGEGRFPWLELRRTPEGYVLFAALPGVRREDVRLSVEARSVMLEGERRSLEVPGLPEGAEVVRRERRSGRFRRTISLPEPVDTARVKARLREGLLVIDLPRPEAGTAREVQIDVEEGQ